MKIFFNLCLCALLLSGCARTDGPSVNLVTVHFEDATVLETTAVFTIRLSNESPAPEKFTGSIHKIYLNGLYVGKGLSSESVEVPRLGTVTQDITVHLSNLALATRIKSVVAAKSFDYRVQSLFYGTSWFSRVRSQTEGKLDAKDFLPDEPKPAAPPPAPQ